MREQKTQCCEKNYKCCRADWTGLFTLLSNVLSITQVRSAFGESMVDILSITSHPNFKTYAMPNNKTRLFKDDKSVFQEMKNKRKKGKTIIAE